MGSIAFGVSGAVAGAAIGGPVGALVGFGAAVAGAAFDSVLLPTLFPPDKIRSGRLREIPFGSFTEGAPIRRIYGRARVPCMILWKSPLISETTTSGGRKTPEVETTKYFSSVAAAVGETSPLIDKGITIQQILADGKKLYDGSVVTSPQNSSTTITLTVLSTGLAFRGRISSTQNLFTDFKSNFPCTVSGASNTTWNRQFFVRKATATSLIVESGLKNQPSATEAAGAAITVLQEGVPNFDDEKLPSTPNIYSGATFELLGQPVFQNPDPIIESFEGAGNVEAFRGIAYFVVDRIALSFYQNRIPNFEAVVDAGTQGTLTVGDVINYELELAGFSTTASVPQNLANVDTSACTELIEGYIIDGPAPVSETIKPLFVAYDLIEQYQDGNLIIRPRETIEVVQIDEDDLMVAEGGSDAPDGPEFNDDLLLEPITKVEITFLDSGNDYLPSTVSDLIDNQDRNTASFEFSMVMSSFKAREIAERILWQSQKLGRQVRLQLPIKFAKLTENDILQFEFGGDLYTVIATQVSTGFNGIVEVRAAVIDQELFTGQIDDNDVLRSRVLFKSGYDIEVLDIPGFRAEDQLGSGVYLVAGSKDPDIPYGIGPRVLFSNRPEDNFVPISFRTGGSDFAKKGVIGTTLGAFPDIQAGKWNLDATIDVELTSGALETIASKQEAYAGRNLACLIGDENDIPTVFAFLEANLLAPRTYRLRGLLARRIAKLDFDLHAGARFVALDDSVQFLGLGFDEMDDFLFVKGVGEGQDETQVLAVQSKIDEKYVVRPFGPNGVRVQRRESDGNIKIRWRVRSRRLQSIFSPVSFPDEEFLYRIRFFKNGVQTHSVVQTPGTGIVEEYDWTAASQSTNGYSAGNAVVIDVEYSSSTFFGTVLGFTAGNFSGDNRVTFTY